jgi:hypothetical protein
MRNRRALDAAWRIVSDGRFRGRILVGEFSWAIADREVRPIDLGRGENGVLESSRRRMESFQGRDMSELPLRIADLRTQRWFEEKEERWAEVMKNAAPVVLEFHRKKSMERPDRAGASLDRLFEYPEGRQLLVAIAEMAFPHYARPAWRRFLLRSRKTCMRPAFARDAALMIHYMTVSVEAPELSVPKMKNSHRDKEYVILASYAGALCTGDAGAKSACRSAFGTRVKLLKVEDVFETPEAS